MNSGQQDPKRLGILGGGQLARMLCDAANQMGLAPDVLVEGPNEPAAQVAKKFSIGRLTDSKALTSFLSGVDTAIIESEFVDCDLLDQAASAHDGNASHSGGKVVPSTKVIRKLQDKIQQKMVLETAQVPTSPWRRKPIDQSWHDWLGELFVPGRSKRFVLKWARLGYDGKGTLLDDGSVEHPARATAWCLDAEKRGIEVFAEDQIRFKSEVAIIAAHATTGEFAFWPLVISRQKNGVCEEVIGPATRFDVPRSVEENAKAYAASVAKTSGLIGVFAIEFFLDEKNQLLVNEIAPRVHNTGHWSMNGAQTSQFENHWRAVLGLPLGPTEGGTWFSMLNLLGPPGLSGSALNLSPDPTPGVWVHWYGKAELRPGRKMGHLNIHAQTHEEFQTRLSAMKQCHANWISKIASQIQRG